MPSVTVALRALAAGKTVRIHDVISYIMTTSTSSGIPASEPFAKRAFAPQEVCSASSELKPDVDWYLYKQLFPPIERLCAPLEGTDSVRLAECLGLDTKKYSIGSSATPSDRNRAEDLCPLESQIPDEVRFKTCTRFSLKCRYCKHSFEFEGLVKNLANISVEGIHCPKPSPSPSSSSTTEEGGGCGRLFSTLTIVAQLEHAIRQSTSRYYDSWLLCDDPSCGNRTRSVSVYGHRCLGPRGRAEGCLGRMRYERGEREMYNQLLYFQHLWKVDGVVDGDGKGVGLGSGKGGFMGMGGMGEEEREKCKVVGERNRERWGTCWRVVEGYLAKCGRVWVQMDGLFGFMLK